MDLYDEIQAKTAALDKCVKALRSHGRAFAEAERNYKVKLAQECLRLRDEGMAIGLIDKVCYGLPSIASLRFERDTAEVVYKANLEAINSIKLQIRILDAQLSREWGTPLSE